MTLSSDGRWLVTGSGDATAQLWEVSTGTSVRSFEGHGGFVNGTTLAGGDQWLLTASADRTVRLWELASGKTAYIYQGLADPVQSVSVKEDGKELTMGMGSRPLETTSHSVWDLVAGKQLRLVREPAAEMRSLAASGGRPDH